MHSSHQQTQLYKWPEPVRICHVLVYNDPLSCTMIHVINSRVRSLIHSSHYSLSYSNVVHLHQNLRGLSLMTRTNLWHQALIFVAGRYFWICGITLIDRTAPIGKKTASNNTVQLFFETCFTISPNQTTQTIPLVLQPHLPMRAGSWQSRQIFIQWITREHVTLSYSVTSDPLPWPCPLTFPNQRKT